MKGKLGASVGSWLTYGALLLAVAIVSLVTRSAARGELVQVAAGQAPPASIGR